MSHLEAGNPGIESTKSEASPILSEKKQLVVPKTASSDVAPQTQFKIVRVRKPDGTIVKVKRPITAEEFSKLAAASTKPEAASTQVSNPTNAENSNDTPAPVSKPAKVVPKTKASTAIKDEKLNSVAVKTTSDDLEKRKHDPEKSALESPQSAKKPADQATSPTTQQTSSTKTDQTLNTVAHGTRLYRSLHRLHKGSSRLVSVLAPQWDIDDWQEGDEDFSDDDDDNDEDEEKYDSDDDNQKAAGGDSHSHGTTNTDMNAAAKGFTTAAATDIAAAKTQQRPQPQTVEKETKPTKNTKSASTEKAAVINEKEVSGSDIEKSSIEKPLVVVGRSLEKRYKDWSRYIIWSIMILFPLLFMIVGILVACRDKKPTEDSLGSGTDQALKVAISVWPIIFAAIVAQSLRAYATYKVERGVRLMTLEQLVNSNSVASSIKQPFLLRRFNWITVALLVLWGLSPLATQAMQRISDTSSAVTVKSSTLRYVDTAANYSNYLSASSDAFGKVEAEFNRLYSASFLQTPTSMTYGSDPYNNALIPLLDFDDLDDEDVPNSSWQKTDPSTGFMPFYSSAYGVPVAVVNDSSEYDYFYDTSTYNVTIKAAYLSFSCPPLRVMTSAEMDNTTLDVGDASETTLYMSMTPMSGRTTGSLALASLITSNTTIPGHPTDINLTSIPDTDWTYAYTNCSFNQTFVDANISCQSSLCYTYAVKPSDITDTPGYVDSGAENWVTGLLGTSGTTSYSSVTATDTERYIISDGVFSESNRRMNLTTTDSEQFTRNLAFLMNTFWSIGFAPTNLTNVFYNSSRETFNPDLDAKLLATYASGNKIDPYSIYITNWGWLAALMICSAFLLLAGIFSIWWDARTVSPDVLGFASSVVRKSKYVQLPPVDSAASGAERARALGNVRVMMQDVKPQAPVGRIALGTAHPNAKRLQSGRNYR